MPTFAVSSVSINTAVALAFTSTVSAGGALCHAPDGSPSGRATFLSQRSDF
jgi:hypothetical protein